MTDIELLDYTEAVFSAPTYTDSFNTRSFSCSSYENESSIYEDRQSSNRYGNYDHFNNVLKSLSQPFYL